MASNRLTTACLAICALVLLCAALQAAGSFLAPMTCALFGTALAWPLQKALQRRLPAMLALAITLVVSLAVIGALGSIVAWGVARAGGWLAGNAGVLQAFYQRKVALLAEHDIYLGSLAAEHFNISWLLGLFQAAAGQLQGFLSFVAVMFIFIMLGLLEVDRTCEKISALSPGAVAVLLDGGVQTAQRLRRYMLVRTLMSATTGAGVWALTTALGLPLAMEWGAIAFALNYIPYIGSFVATLLPTLVALMQFDSMAEVATVFLGLNLVQFVVGSYIEPRVTGAAMSVSPLVVLLAVFVGTFLWGIAGTFIGVPVVIAIVTLCSKAPSSRWISDLLAA